MKASEECKYGKRESHRSYMGWLKLSTMDFVVEGRVRLGDQKHSC
jgi:hypothetical protein